MTVLTRIFPSLVLSLALVLTGQSMAIARGMAPAADQIVICTGTGPVMILIDSEGNPTAPSHLCPDCALSLLQAVFPPETGLSGLAGWRKVEMHYVAIVVADPGPAFSHARDPPSGL